MDTLRLGEEAETVEEYYNHERLHEAIPGYNVGGTLVPRSA